MFRFLVRQKQVNSGCNGARFLEVLEPREVAFPFGRGRLQLDVVPLAKASRENERGGGVIAEPVGASLVRFVTVDASNRGILGPRSLDEQSVLPDHNVTKPEDPHDRGDAHMRQIERIDSLDLHSRHEGARRLAVLGKHVGRAVAVVEVVARAPTEVFWAGHNLMIDSFCPTDGMNQWAFFVTPEA